MRDRRRLVPWIVLALLGATAIPHRADAQWRRDRGRDRDRDRDSYRRDEWADRDLTFSVGALASDDEDRNFPMASLRVGWRLRSWLRSELGVSYATGSADHFVDNPPHTVSATIQLATATLGLRAEAPLAYVRPYVGASAGLFGQQEEGGDRFIRTTMAFPAGLRLLLSPRLALQGEVRFRFDQQQRGGQSVNVEQTGGIAVAF